MYGFCAAHSNDAVIATAEGRNCFFHELFTREQFRRATLL
jgi:hypothetical protein